MKKRGKTAKQYDFLVLFIVIVLQIFCGGAYTQCGAGVTLRPEKGRSRKLESGRIHSVRPKLLQHEIVAAL